MLIIMMCPSTLTTSDEGRISGWRGPYLSLATMAGGLTWTVFRRYLYAQPGHRTGYGTSRKEHAHTHEDDRDMRREDKEPRKTKMMRIPDALEALVATKRGASIPPT